MNWASIFYAQKSLVCTHCTALKGFDSDVRSMVFGTSSMYSLECIKIKIRKRRNEEQEQNWKESNPRKSNGIICFPFNGIPLFGSVPSAFYTPLPDVSVCTSKTPKIQYRRRRRRLLIDWHECVTSARLTILFVNKKKLIYWSARKESEIWTLFECIVFSQHVARSLFELNWKWIFSFDSSATISTIQSIVVISSSFINIG